MERSKADRGPRAIQIIKNKNGVDHQVLLQNRRGHSVLVGLLGGQVLSWKINPREELLFISNKATATAARGGIPICFPQYESGNSLEHGFARNRMWGVDNNPPPLDPNDFNDKTYIDLLLKPSADDLKVWPHDFEFRLRVALALDGSLYLTSRIRNISCKRFSFFFAHHPYFAVPDISDVRVEGLDTLYYLDNLKYEKLSTEQDASLTIESKVDRAYLSSVEDIAVRCHNAIKKRTFLIKKEGLPDVVVWNPWKERNGGTAYFEAKEYMGMICVGGAAIEKPITLNPGEEWKGKLDLFFKRVS